ncbi:unnamed protein product [Brassica napus]|uniref:non-specific serine/threonine protein kinase n=1 Tax=Brassica napus TaxID=3708 RepID=A0A816IRZ3_BRANA|nr:unnamed protein product [Brassica napus]
MVSGASPSRSAPSESSSGFSSSSSGVSRTRMGKYELGSTLGEGTFAKVKFARNIVNGENVAIKIIDKEKVLRNKMIAHIKRDISTMKLIKHPNVIRMLEIFKAEFTCLHWFSASAKKLIKRILDPNPATRITFAEVIENEWFNKGYKAPKYENANVSLDDVHAIFDESGSQNLVVERREEELRTPVTMNAFELISTSKGLNLGLLFEKQMFYKNLTTSLKDIVWKTIDEEKEGGTQGTTFSLKNLFS